MDVCASEHCVCVCRAGGWAGQLYFKNSYSTILIKNWFLGTSESSASDTKREGVDRSTRVWEWRQRQESETKT